jgi:hypothetical protein
MTPFDKAQYGVKQIEDAIVDLLRSRGEGLRNYEIASELGLNSEPGARQRNYLTWQILTRLVDQGRIHTTKTKSGKPVYTSSPTSNAQVARS